MIFMLGNGEYSVTAQINDRDEEARAHRKLEALRDSRMATSPSSAALHNRNLTPCYSATQKGRAWAGEVRDRPNHWAARLP